MGLLVRDGLRRPPPTAIVALVGTCNQWALEAGGLHRTFFTGAATAKTGSSGCRQMDEVEPYNVKAAVVVARDPNDGVLESSVLLTSEISVYVLDKVF